MVNVEDYMEDYTYYLINAIKEFANESPYVKAIESAIKAIESESGWVECEESEDPIYESIRGEQDVGISDCDYCEQDVRAWISYPLTEDIILRAELEGCITEWFTSEPDGDGGWDEDVYDTEFDIDKVKVWVDE